MATQRVATGTALLDPANVLKHVGVAYGQRVADLGCGSGAHFTLQAAKIVGDRGKVYAVDVVKDILPSVQTKAKLEGLDNIETVWTNLEVYGGAKRIADNSLDVALLVNVLFQSKKHVAVFKEARRMVKPGGIVVVIDWKPTAAPIGPVIGDRVTEENIRTAAQSAGLREERAFEPGRFHYGLIFAKT